MDWTSLYADHLKRLSGHAEDALALAREEGSAFTGILFHAGAAACYHADDQEIVFRPVPHYARWAPTAGPDHLLLFRPGRRPRLALVLPRDYWYEAPAEPDHPFARALDVVRVGSAAEAATAIGDVRGCAYVGNDPALAARLGLPAEAVEPPALMAPLDWFRGGKTPYEVACLRAAAAVAARGHLAVKQGVEQGRTERELHAVYLEASGLLESELPYGNIMAWDDRSAVLHYQRKRTTPPTPGATFLIDAGGAHWGYASDITRTYVREGAHPVFREMVARLDAMQRGLVARVGPGRSFVALHEEAHQGVAAILADAGVLRVKPDEAFARGLTRPFLPHGLGHHLGLQVHDVGGRQVTAKGERRDPPAHYPYLRTTRELAAGHVVTIEPGLYFIPMLLEPYRTGKDAAAFDWGLVDALIPCGGIRIEDDVLVTETGHEDLTRSLVP